MGIPCGNTVALVGDPGTGKTTFLLLFFRQGRLRSGTESCGVVLGCRDGAQNPWQDTALAAFDRLLPVPEDEEAVGQDIAKKVRVFISLDNTFESVHRTHGGLLPNTGDAESEYWFFIDATSMLTGRLQDGLRYPRLAALQPDLERQSGWHVEELNLGGWNPNVSEEGPSWYWVRDGERPKPLTDCDAQQNPFLGEVKDQQGEGGQGRCPRRRVLRLMTPYLGDPLRRVALFKDLLAALFSQFLDGQQRPFLLLALDSLSSLLQPPPQGAVEPAPHGRDRRQILNLVRWLEELQVTSLLAVEAHREEGATLRAHPLYMGGLERYLASGVIQLDYHQYPSGDVIRTLQILKMRGIRHDMRPYAYDLDEGGLAWLEPLIADRGGS